jgi:hypothetical protein
MNGVPIAALIAVPIVSAFFLFVLLPRMRREQEEQEERQRGGIRGKRR